MTTSPRLVNDLAESAGTPSDALAMKATRAIAQQIVDVVRDPKMHHSIPLKVARAVAERQLNASEVTTVLDFIEANRRKIRSTGAYFSASLKRAFQAAEIVW